MFGDPPENRPAESPDVKVVGDRASDGERLEEADFTGEGKDAGKTGLYALKKVDLFNLLCIPPYKSDGNVDMSLITDAAKYCQDRRAFLLVDPPTGWIDKNEAVAGINPPPPTPADIERSKNAAVFFPRFMQPNPLRDDQLEERVPCGVIAGIFARTDAQRGVWKAPAGLAATLSGIQRLSVTLTDPEIGELNPLGVNCLRLAPAAGPVVWGARTLEGDDRLASEWKYIPIRRLALFIEESLYRGTQWVVFEPNDEPLWSQIRLNVGAFMRNLFRQGAFQGASPREAYFVKCDNESTTQNDINLGIVNIVVGFAPLKPAEFVVLKIQQIAGEILT
jgi:phage tail sheath protein FI